VNPHLRSACVLSFFVASIVTAGCMTGEGVEEPSAPIDPDNRWSGNWFMHRTCTAVRNCTAERSAYREDWVNTCASCYVHQCVFTCAACSPYCDEPPPYTCSGEDGECVAWDYVFVQVDPTPNAAIETACRSFFATCATGGEDPAMCATFAANERPEIAVAAYECAATTACGGPCYPAPDDEFADRICRSVNDDCEGLGDALASDAAWWTEATRAAVLMCADQPFTMTGACVEAFLNATRRPPA
jgi:hypothetical protein